MLGMTWDFIEGQIICHRQRQGFLVVGFLNARHSRVVNHFLSDEKVEYYAILGTLANQNSLGHFFWEVYFPRDLLNLGD